MHRLLQFTLDLFDPEPAPRAGVPQPQGTNPHPGPGPRGPVDGVLPETVMPERASPWPGEPLAQVVAPVRYAHPRANREVALADARVAYEFQRAKRRTIGFVVGPDGLVVRAPKWVPLHEVDAALREKSGWIIRKLGEARDRQQRLASARIEWRDGVALPFLGEQVTVVLDPRQAVSAAGTVLQTDVQALPGTPRLTLHMGLAHTATPEQIRDAVQAWLMRQARRIFTERLDHFAPQLGVEWKKLSLSSAGTRWGSARADGSIRLNWRLLHFRMPVLDYVVAHELAHLRVMDHSPRFWDTVRTVVPDYAELRSQLRDEAVPPW